MNDRTEVDIALLGYAIQIEREAQYEKLSEAGKQKKGTGEMLQGCSQLETFKNKK